MLCPVEGSPFERSSDGAAAKVGGSRPGKLLSSSDEPSLIMGRWRFALGVGDATLIGEGEATPVDGSNSGGEAAPLDALNGAVAMGEGEAEA